MYRIRYFGHVRRRRPDTLLHKANSYRLTTKRRVGRPRYTFNTTLMNDFKKFPTVTHEEWEEALTNKEILKRLTSSLYMQEDLTDDPLSEELMIYSSDEETA